MLTDALIRTFVKNREDVENARVRYALWTFGGILGSRGQFAIVSCQDGCGFDFRASGRLWRMRSQSSDAGSSIVTLVGFKLSSAPPDKEHPFGHGRDGVSFCSSRWRR